VPLTKCVLTGGCQFLANLSWRDHAEPRLFNLSGFFRDVSRQRGVKSYGIGDSGEPLVAIFHAGSELLIHHYDLGEWCWYRRWKRSEARKNRPACYVPRRSFSFYYLEASKERKNTQRLLEYMDRFKES
jgi:hypothetical protein